jgi:hypothetical protein
MSPSSYGRSVNVDWLPEELYPVAMRLARADELAYALAEAALSWSGGDDDEGALDLTQFERTVGKMSLEVTAIRPVPPMAGLLFSEAIHHLRAAVDNVVFYLVTKERNEPLTPRQEKQVAMLIYDDPDKYALKVKGLVKAGLDEFDPGAVLGKRIAILQPFADEATVTSLGPKLATLLGRVDLEGEKPLSLLQGYSNWDKHRMIRAALTTALTQNDHDPSLRNGGMRVLEVGTVLATVPEGEPVETSVSPALQMLRPDGKTWVALGPELDGIAAHVADVVIPILLKGLALPGALPAQVDLSDNGESMANRLAQGTAVRAHERVRPLMNEAFWKAETRPLKFPPIVRHDELDQASSPE